MCYIIWKQSYTYDFSDRSSKNRIYLLRYLFLSFLTSQRKLSASHPEIFYHGWQNKYLLTSAVLEVAHTTAQVMICLLFSPLSEKTPERMIDDNFQGSEERL